jgi:hypothetical protein
VELHLASTQRFHRRVYRSQEVLALWRIGTDRRRKIQRHGHSTLANFNALNTPQRDDVTARAGLPYSSQGLHNVLRVYSIRHLN